MKNHLLLISVFVLILLSSCSSKRFGNIPKVKAQSKKEQTAKRKSAKKQIILAVKPFVPAVKSVQLIDSFRVKPIRKTFVKKQLKRFTTSAKTIVHAPKITTTTINHTKEKHTKKNSNLWEDFWYSDFGELLIYIATVVIIILIYLLVEWLFSIGLGWVVLILGLALLIYILYLLNELLNDVLDFFFRR
ncbi:MAG: hypothetical protein ACO1PI_12165 [Bacteroidota bacterium]